MEYLDTITTLSHEFGTDDYVRGGGGNTSCKDDKTLWVKPSGTTLSQITSDQFVALDRAKLSELYEIEPPEDASGREALVKQKMEQAVLPTSSGRASVEAPLHNSLSARYVVHTHPAVVNGMTCAKNGKTVAQTLFPDALWLDYIDPGYTLCMETRKAVGDYQRQCGQEPAVIFLKNHGVFVSADDPDRIHSLYDGILSKINAEYEKAGIGTDLHIAPLLPNEERNDAEQTIRAAMQNPALEIAAGGAFDYAAGPVTPDHIVYSKSYFYVGEPTVEGVKEFTEKQGYLPQVIVYNNAVFGISESAKGAALALEFAQDAALVKKLAQAFGGLEFMTDQAREFIENWEVESYRKKQMEQ